MCNNDAIKTIEYKGYNIEIYRDELTPNPREWDNFGTLDLYHRRYDLPNESGYDPEELQQEVKDCFWLPVWGYDHGQLWIKAGSRSYPFDCPWDSGQLGVVWVSKDRVRQEFKKQRISKKLQAKVFDLLRAEVETYNQYITGDVYFYSIDFREDEQGDSCGGFYGSDWENNGLLDYAKAAIDFEIDFLKECEKCLS